MPQYLAFRPILASIPDIDSMLGPVRDAMFNTVEPEIERRLREKWKGDIDFDKIRTDNKDRISVLVRPAGENQQKWIWVSLGTPPHDIPKTPKPPGKFLKFKWGGPGSHNPKTAPYKTPLRLGSGASPEYVYFKQVRHPGIQPRYFEKQVFVEYRGLFKETMKRAFESGVKANK